jgi:quinol monooxygenase YgiN
MERMARIVTFTAAPGRADELAARLTTIAERMDRVEGCLLYLVHRNPAEPDQVWVTELWRSADDVEAALEVARQGDEIGEVMAMIAGPPERTDLAPVGGLGPS